MPKYYFLQADELPAEMQQHVQVLQQAPLDAFKQLIQASFKIMTGETELASLDTLQAALEPAAEKCNVPVSTLMSVIRSLTLIFQGTVRHNVKLEQLVADFQTLGFADSAMETGDDRTKYVAAVWKKYFISVSKEVLAQTLQVQPLMDMDWRFGVTASSSEQERVGKTFLQLKLRFFDEGTQTAKDTFLELSLAQFYDFLHQMEKAKATLDFFS